MQTFLIAEYLRQIYLYSNKIMKNKFYFIPLTRRFAAASPFGEAKNLQYPDLWVMICFRGRGEKTAQRLSI